jgi:hypothetical protein
MLQLRADLFSPSQRRSGADDGRQGGSDVDSDGEMRTGDYHDASNESESTPPAMPFKKQR